MATKSNVPIEHIEKTIYLIRGEKVMLDFDLAKLYGVETKRLVEAVKRNAERFPKEFMFQLSKRELEDWRSQFATSNLGSKMGLRRAPYAFTEHGALMLSSVLRSKRAAQVSIQVVRTFVQLRQMASSHAKLAARLDELEATHGHHIIWKTIEDLVAEIPAKDKKPVGFGRR